MDKKRLHNIKSKVIWTAIMAAIGILLIASIQRKVNVEMESVVVAIKPIVGDNDLITEKEVLAYFNQYLGYDLRRATVEDIDLREMEDMLNKDQRVKISQIFIDGLGRLNIWIIQRQPIVRIIDGIETSYYLDDEGNKLAALPNKSIRVPVATGMIELYQEQLLKGEQESRLREVFEIAKHIHQDDMLRALIEQIDVEPSEIVLIPKIGRHELTVGDSQRLKDKFDNLKIFYKEGLPREGWRKYSVLQLNFEGQLAATLRNSEKR